MEDLSHIYFVADPAPARRAAVRLRPPLCQALGARPMPATAAGEDGALDPFISWLLRKGGLDVSAYRPRALQRRLSACLRRLRVRSTADAVALLGEQTALLHSAIDALLIGVSDFFRDPLEFEHLGAVVLPRMLSERPNLRVLSAGCSSGQELYSVAMLLDELGGLDGARLLGIECRPDAIEQARRGIFDAGATSGLDALRRARYFRAEGLKLRATPRLCARLEWRVDDLLGSAESSTWDLILFRNVAIYLSRPAPLWERLTQQLAPDGTLMTGKAETPPRPLPLVRETRCLYRKVDHA